MRIKRYFQVVAFRAGLVVLAAGFFQCGDSTAPGGTDAGPPGEGQACSGPDQCDQGLTCYQEVCRQACDSDADCDEQTRHCEDGVCVPGPRVCGNGELNPGETCDDGNQADGDGCSQACQAEAGWYCGGEPSVCETRCGDGVLAGGEVCDDGNQGLGDSCPSGADGPCEPASCGDGYVWGHDGGDETCDDANTEADDGCDATCRLEPGWYCNEEPSVCTTECGDGIPAGDEECDDGNGLQNDSCLDGQAGSCRAARCGDGILWTTDGGNETCDDTNIVDGDGCSSTCQIEAGWDCEGEPTECVTECGDGVPAGTEQCDDGNGALNDSCPDGEQGTCQSATCGDGYLWTTDGGSEACDDGNTTPGDGCDAVCQIEQVDCNTFVNLLGTPGGDGSSWETAFTQVQPGIDRAYQLAGGLSDCQVWVAQGVYYIHQGDGTDTVLLKERVSVFGGFAGDEELLLERDPELNVTVLDGSHESDPAQQVYHVVTGASHAVIDGFTVRNGAAIGTDDADQAGGGMFNGSVTDLTVRNCIFADNLADDNGGGIYSSNSTATIADCDFTANSAGSGGGIYNDSTSLIMTACTFTGNSAGGTGGAIKNTNASSPEISDCVFDGNSASGGGGAIENRDSSDAAITGCTFTGNSGGSGGAIFNWNSSPTLTGCTISYSQAGDDGGAINNNHSSPVIENCGIHDNAADGNGGGMFNWNSSPQVTDCVFTGNSSTGIGGGVSNQDGSEPSFDGCLLSHNTGNDGGGMGNRHSSPAVNACVFTSNTALSGGAMDSFFFNESAITNSAFVANWASGGGTTGGLSFGQDSNFTVAGCTFFGNTVSTSGGAVLADGAQVLISSSILWGDTAPEIMSSNSVVDVRYSTVGGGAAGCAAAAGGQCNYDASNISSDPAFNTQIVGLTAGSWDTVDHDPDMHETTLSDNDAGWIPAGLVGLFVRPDTNANWYFMIKSSTSSSVTVYGNIETFAAANGNYQLIDFRLSASSPCLDAGADADGLTEDLTGQPRLCQSTGQPGCPDMGAWEF